MNFIELIKNKAKMLKKKIVLPESMDERVLKAARIVTDEKIAEIILIGEEEKIIEFADKIDVNLENIEIVNPQKFAMFGKLVNDLFILRKEKGLTIEKAKELLLYDYMYFACMMVYEGLADGVVSGACHSSSDTLRPALQIIKTDPNYNFVSSFFVMVVPNCQYGSDGVFIFSDAGLVQEIDAKTLAEIAYQAAQSFEQLTENSARVAMLSYSTKGSAEHENVAMVREATNKVLAKHPNMIIDGELQLDAAIVPEVAKIKAPNSILKGQANVLIFPSLDAGNIGYKLVERLANAEAYGPITQGINKPINDLSRGCSVDDIVGVIAITVVQTK